MKARCSFELLQTEVYAPSMLQLQEYLTKIIGTPLFNHQTERANVVSSDSRCNQRADCRKIFISDENFYGRTNLSKLSTS